MPTERYESARSMGAARTLGSAHAGDVQPASFQLTAETVARVQRSADLRKSAALGGMPNGRVLVIVGVKATYLPRGLGVLASRGGFFDLRC